MMHVAERCGGFAGVRSIQLEGLELRSTAADYHSPGASNDAAAPFLQLMAAAARCALRILIMRVQVLSSFMA